MAKKKAMAIVKIQIPAGQASPAPPVGTALGPHGVAIMDFCKEYNAKTEDKRGQIVPVEITIYEDRSFTFITKTPPTSFLIRQAAKLDKAAENPGREVAGSISWTQVEEIAEAKMPTSMPSTWKAPSCRLQVLHAAWVSRSPDQTEDRMATTRNGWFRDRGVPRPAGHRSRTRGSREEHHGEE